MITKMNKLTLLVYHKEYTAFLERLREVGVVHIVEREKGGVEDPELEKQLALAGRYARTIKRLEQCAVEQHAPAGELSQALAIVEKYESLVAEIEQYKTLLQVVEKDIATLEPWGDFKFSTLEKLEKAGYEVRFFISSVKAFDSEWEKRYNAIKVAEKQSRIYFVTVTPSGVDVDIDAEPARLPSSSLSKLISEKERVVKTSEAKVAELDTLAAEHLATLREAHALLLHNIEFAKVVLDGKKVSGDKLLLLEGWFPEENSAELKAMLDESGAFYEVRAVKRGDEAPVKLKNNAFTRMYEMLTKMYGILGI